MEKKVTTTIYECDNCKKEEAPFVTPEKDGSLEELPIGWFRFRLSIELKAAPKRTVSSGGGDHRCACSIKCMKAVVAADLKDLDAKKVIALNDQKAKDKAKKAGGE